LGDAGLLEPRDVLPLHLAVDDGEMLGHARERHVGSADSRDAEHPLWMEDRHRPGDEAAPVVADEDGTLDFERIEEANQIAGELGEPVGLDRGRGAAPAITALIGSNGAKSRPGDRLELMAPPEGEVRKAVTEDDRRPVAKLVRGQRDRRSVALVALPSSR